MDNWEAFALDIGARKINRDETTRVCAVAKTAEKAGVESSKGNRGWQPLQPIHEFRDRFRYALIDIVLGFVGRLQLALWYKQ